MALPQVLTRDSPLPSPTKAVRPPRANSRPERAAHPGLGAAQHLGQSTPAGQSRGSRPGAARLSPVTSADLAESSAAESVHWRGGSSLAAAPTGLRSPGQRGLQASPFVFPSRGQPAQGPGRACPPTAKGGADGRTPSPACSLQAPPSTDDSSPVSRRPQATWVGSRTYLLLRGPPGRRSRVTALGRTPGRALVSGQARTESAGSRGHDTPWTPTWPQHGPPPPPAAGPGRLPSAAAPRGGPAPASWPDPARLGMHDGKCSPQSAAARGAGGGAASPRPAPSCVLSGPASSRSQTPAPAPYTAGGLFPGRETPWPWPLLCLWTGRGAGRALQVSSVGWKGCKHMVIAKKNILLP